MPGLPLQGRKNRNWDFPAGQQALQHGPIWGDRTNETNIVNQTVDLTKKDRETTQCRIRFLDNKRGSGQFLTTATKPRCHGFLIASIMEQGNIAASDRLTKSLLFSLQIHLHMSFAKVIPISQLGLIILAMATGFALQELNETCKCDYTVKPGVDAGWWKPASQNQQEKPGLIKRWTQDIPMQKNLKTVHGGS